MLVTRLMLMLFAPYSLALHWFFSVLPHSTLARRLHVSHSQNEAQEQAEKRLPASALTGAHPGNFYTEPDAGYVRLRIFRFDRRINQFTSKAENSNLGDLAFVCSNLWDVKGPGQLGFWRFGSMMSVYHVDVKLNDALGPYLLCSGGQCGGDRHNPKVAPAEHNEFGLAVRGDSGSTFSQTGCVEGDSALKKLNLDFRWYSLKTANTEEHPDAEVDPLAEWRNVKYVGTVDMSIIFTEDSFEEIQEGVENRNVLDIIFQRIEQALTQESSGCGRVHDKWEGERCSDKSEEGNSLGLHSCQKSWMKSGRCAWIDSGMCVPNCVHKDNWQHPALCLSMGPCKWDGERCSFDSEKVWTVQSASCQNETLTETQQDFCKGIAGLS